MTKAKVIALQIFLTWILSNVGFFMVAYAGWKMNYYGDHVFYKLMMYNGIYFCVGAGINTLTLLRFA